MTETGLAHGRDTSGTEQSSVSTSKMVRQVEKLIRSGERRKVLAILGAWAPSDVLSLFVGLRTNYARKLLEWMPEEVGIGVLAELDPRLHAVLAEEKTRSTFRKLIEKLDPDEAFPLLDELPHEYALDILAGHPHEAALRKALEVDEDHAAAHMRRGILTARGDGTVGEVIASIRANADEIERLERIYVVDEDRRVLGELRRRGLLMSPDETPVAEILRPDPVVVAADTDQEDVLLLAKKRRIHSIAVVDAERRLLGSITPRELLAATMVAGSFGALIPFALSAFKLDPAVSTGIFITTSNDVFGVLIFFTFASIFYL